MLVAASALCWLSKVAHGETLGIAPQTVQNFYGEAGLLDMPSARFQPDGELSLTFAAMPVGERYSLSFQALPWLETEFRYSRLDRVSLHRDDYDRSLGFKIRLSQEGNYWPSIVVGAQDILGTGAFGAEYLAASKRVGSLDFTLGMGWRRFSGFASFENPLGIISKSFLTVPARGSGGGRPLISQFFHGPDVGLFGGITWDTPIDNLTLIAEISGDPYSQQQKSGAINVRMPLNFGFSYQPLDDVQISGGYMYGSQLGVRVSLLLDSLSPIPNPKLGKQPVPIQTRTPEARETAVLSMLQEATNYYDNAPFPNISAASKSQAANVTPAGFADALFENASYQDLAVQDIETFGRDLIVDISASKKRPSCTNVSGIASAASAAGFEEIVFTSDDGANAAVCEVDTPKMQASVFRYSNALPDTGDAPGVPDGQEASRQDDTLESKIQKALEDQNIIVVGLKVSFSKVELAFSNATYQTETEAIGRILRVLMANSPDSVETFRLVSVTAGVATTGETFSRSDIERTLGLYGSGMELLATTEIATIGDDDPLLSEDAKTEYPAFGYGLSPGYRHSLFDPDNPYRFDIYASATGGVALNRNISLTGSVELDIYNTFNIIRKSNSVLPHVRSDFAQYYKEGINGISDLMGLYVGKLSSDVYVQARAGYLESMFAGFGGEVYWQPPHSRISFGGALYAVQQRNFDRLFGLQNYRIVTGHLSVYYDSPFYDLDYEVHAGRYLAGDYGATFQVTRRFPNGIEVGAYVTLTNVPFSKFGEGSFDKGIIVHIPLGDIAPVNTQDEMSLDFSPLTRDGGQRLDGEETFHEALRRSSESELLPTWYEVLRP